MHTSTNPVAHLDALDLGYRLWATHSQQDPLETAHDELSWQQRMLRAGRTKNGRVFFLNDAISLESMKE